MKKFKCLLAAVLLACSTASFAQFTNGGGGGVSSDVEAWKGLRFSYDHTFSKIDVDEADDLGYDGFSIGYVQAWKIAKQFPIFFETGLGLTLHVTVKAKAKVRKSMATRSVMKRLFQPRLWD